MSNVICESCHLDRELRKTLEDTAKKSDLTVDELVTKLLKESLNPSFTLNLNSKIKVKLNEDAFEVLKKYTEAIDNQLKSRSASYRASLPETDENGYYTFVFWEFISIFGNKFFCGYDDIDPDIIVLR